MTFEWISFTTDYGLSDGFVASCHGVAARLAPAVRIIDVTHQVPPGDVRRGATVLAQTVVDLPRAVHVAVVDPGVGTPRRAVALLTAAWSVLVGPDNGLLLPAAAALGGVTTAVELTDPAWHASRVSRTFHGRDIFMPVAARLALGADLSAAGPQISDLSSLVPPAASWSGDTLVAEVLAVDRFGNVQLATSDPGTVQRLGTTGSDVLTVNGVPARLVETFGDVPPGDLAVLVDSAGYLSVAVNAGNAAMRLNLKPGDVVRVAPPAVM